MEWLVIGLALLALLVLAGVVWRLYRQISVLRVDSVHLDLLQRQISSLQMDLHQLSQQVAQSSSGVATFSVQDTSSGTPYNQAIELVRQGLTASDVASRCGISRSEAELIVSLYRNSSTS